MNEIISSNDEQDQKDPPIPTPGWICAAKVDKQEAIPQESQFVQGPGGGPGFGFVKPAVEIIEAIVVAVGDWTYEVYDAHPEWDRLACPFEVGSKVYYPDQGGVIEINGYHFFQMNHVVAYER